MRPLRLDRLWTTPDRLFGLLLLPADDGGQAVTVRVGKLTARIEVDVWRQPPGKAPA
jgi:hypothetical protein